MGLRYAGRKIVRNADMLYREQFQKRGIKSVVQYTTPTLRYPTEDQMREIKTIGHIWRTGDKYYKLAAQYYNNEDLWWVIAWFNKKPTEAHVTIGDVIHIPIPLETVLRYYGV